MKKFILILFAIILSISPITIYSHPGRTDANGGHWNRSTGTYHYHNDGYVENEKNTKKNNSTIDSIEELEKDKTEKRFIEPYNSENPSPTEYIISNTTETDSSSDNTFIKKTENVVKSIQIVLKIIVACILCFSILSILIAIILLIFSVCSKTCRELSINFFILALRDFQITFCLGCVTELLIFIPIITEIFDNSSVGNIILSIVSIILISAAFSYVPFFLISFVCHYILKAIEVISSILEILFNKPVQTEYSSTKAKIKFTPSYKLKQYRKALLLLKEHYDLIFELEQKIKSVRSKLRVPRELLQDDTIRAKDYYESFGHSFCLYRDSKKSKIHINPYCEDVYNAIPICNFSTQDLDENFCKLCKARENLEPVKWYYNYIEYKELYEAFSIEFSKREKLYNDVIYWEKECKPYITGKTKFPLSKEIQALSQYISQKATQVRMQGNKEKERWNLQDDSK